MKKIVSMLLALVMMMSLAGGALAEEPIVLRFWGALQPEYGYAEIEKNAVVVGCSDYAEIWAEANYERMVDDVDDEALRRALEACGL